MVKRRPPITTVNFAAAHIKRTFVACPHTYFNWKKKYGVLGYVSRGASVKMNYGCVRPLPLDSLTQKINSIESSCQD